MLRTFLQKGYYSFHEGFENWEDAIVAAVQPMVEHGAVKPAYADSIIKCVRQYGPYIVIAPNICIPHAEDPLNVIETSVGFMKCSRPVSFSDDPEQCAQLFFVLASNNEEKHLQNLKSLMKMLTDQELMDSLAKVKNGAELAKLAVKDV